VISEAVVSLIRMLVALEILLLPIWVGTVGVRPPPSAGRRLARAPAAVVPAAAVLLVLGAMAGGGGEWFGAVLKSQAVAIGFVILLAGLATVLDRAAGPRAAQVLTIGLGAGLVGAILWAGPMAEILEGPVRAAVVRIVVHANPLVVAEHELGLEWMHQGLTYRLTPIGESYSYLLGDVAWWKTMLGYVFVGSGLAVFSIRRTGPCSPGQAKRASATSEGIARR
jgi:hypothetical protein